MPTGTHDVRARVLQIAAVYDKEFLNQVEAEYGLIRSQPKDPLGSVTASARQHIQVLLTNGSIDGTTELMRALSNLASVLYARGQVVAARELTRKLETMEPNPPFGYFKRGLAAMQAKDYALARDMFEKEVDRAAYYHEFHFWLALAYVGLGDMEKARAHMATAEENSTTRSDHDLYAAKLDRLRAYAPTIRR